MNHVKRKSAARIVRGTDATLLARDRHDLDAQVNKPPPPRRGVRRRRRRSDGAPTKVTNQQALITLGYWRSTRIRLSIDILSASGCLREGRTIRSNFNKAIGRRSDSSTTINFRNFSIIVSCNVWNVINREDYRGYDHHGIILAPYSYVKKIT